MKPTIADVARAAGVSRTSVSFAFNNPGRVGQATLARILDSAGRLGYVPDPVARSMSSGRTGTVGVLVPQPLAEMARNPFFTELLAGFAAVAEAGDHPVLLVSPRQGSMEQAVHGAAVDGFLTLGLEEFRPTVQLLESRHLPFVMVDSEPVADLPCVNADDEGGAYLAMKAVLDAGHRRIGVLGIESPPPHEWTGYTGTLARRIAGYRGALAEVGLDIGDVALVETPTSEDDGRAATERLIDADPEITAIVAMADIVALGALEAAEGRGIDVPTELSVVGFDGIPQARWNRPALTTVSQNAHEKGRVAGELLVDLIAGRSGTTEHIVLPTTLLPGATLVAPTR